MSQFAPEYPEQFTRRFLRLADGGRREEVRSKSARAAQILVPPTIRSARLGPCPISCRATNWVTEISPGTPVQVGIGYENNSGFAATFRPNVQSLMQGKNSSIYVRIPFQVDTLDDVSELLFRVKFDDGYLMYLNGVPLDVQNGPFFGSYNSTATKAQPNQDAVVFQRDRLELVLGQAAGRAERARLAGLEYQREPTTTSCSSPNSSPRAWPCWTTRVAILRRPLPGQLNPSEFALGPVDQQRGPHAARTRSR